MACNKSRERALAARGRVVAGGFASAASPPGNDAIDCVVYVS